MSATKTTMQIYIPTASNHTVKKTQKKNNALDQQPSTIAEKMHPNVIMKYVI